VPNRDIGCDSVEIGNFSHGRDIDVASSLLKVAQVFGAGRLTRSLPLSPL
jgi:hypothetical protein